MFVDLNSQNVVIVYVHILRFSRTIFIRRIGCSRVSLLQGGPEKLHKV